MQVCFLADSGLFCDCLMSPGIHLLVYMFCCGSCFFFWELLFNFIFFFGEVPVLLFNYFFWELARCVVLAANDLSGDYLRCFFDIIFMCIIPDVCCFFSACYKSIFGGFGTICVSCIFFFLDQEVCCSRHQPAACLLIILFDVAVGYS